MAQFSGPQPISLHSVLRDTVDQMQRISGAEIVSLYLFDDETQEYYAPVAAGLPESSLVGSMSDLRDQLARYRADAAQGKAPGPDTLHLKHYGPNVWLTVTRRRLLSRDAESDIASTFIRRYNIQSVLGLPLISGDALVGLLYLDFCAKPGEEESPSSRPDAELLSLLEREAAQAATTDRVPPGRFEFARYLSTAAT